MNLNSSNIVEFLTFLRKHPQYFIENFLFIRPKGEPISPFKLNPSQKVFMRIIEKDIAEKKPGRYIVVKNRQCGISTFSEALMFHRTILNPSYNSLILSPEREKSQEIYQIAQLFYDRLPDWMRPMRRYRTKNELRFENPNEKERQTNPGLGSSFTITHAKNYTAPRGKALSAAHISEAPYYDYAMEELYPALSQSITENQYSLIIIESTPKGRGGWFHEMYEMAKEGETTFTPVFLPWYIDTNCRWPYELEEKDIKDIMSDLDEEEKELVRRYNVDAFQILWRRHNIVEKCNGNVTKFHMENPTNEEEAFALSGTNMFTQEARTFYTEEIEREKHKVKVGFLFNHGNPYLENPVIRFQESKDPEAPYEMIVPPKRGEEYVVGIDPSFGKGRDYSAMVVLNKNHEVCATYYSNTVPPEEFRQEIVRMGKFYGDAKINLETSGPGNGIMWMLKKQYRNWFMWEKWDSYEKRRKLTAIGWDATGRSISVVDNMLSWAVNSKLLKIRSPRILQELLSYSYNEILDRGSAPVGGKDHDDLIRSLGLALLTLDQIGNVPYAPESIVGDGGLIYPSNFETSVSSLGSTSTFPAWYLD